MTSGRIKTIIAAAAIAVPVVGWAGPASAAPPVNCGATVHGSVVLKHDLHCHGAGVMLTSGTLNLNHHTISGDGTGNGVVVAGASATIKNGRISSFANGVTADVDGAAVTLDYLTISQSTGAAVDGTTINFASLNKVTLKDNPGDALVVIAPNSASVSHSTIIGSGRAIALVADGEARVSDTTLDSNTVGVYCSEGLVSVNHSMISNNSTGASLFECEGSDFTSSGFVGNHGSGIAETDAFTFTASPTLTVSHDVFYKNGTGLTLSAQGRADVIRDSAFVSNGSGIVAQPCDACDLVPADQLISNYFAYNTADGANWGYGEVTVTHNRFISNGGWGFIAGAGATVTNGGGNTAHKNHSGNCSGLTCAS